MHARFRSHGFFSTTKEKANRAPADVVWRFCCGPLCIQEERPRETKLVYEKYIDSYVERHCGGSKSREDVVREAQMAWKDIKGDTAKVEKFVSDVEEWKTRQVPDILWVSLDRTTSTASTETGLGIASVSCESGGISQQNVSSLADDVFSSFPY